MSLPQTSFSHPVSSAQCPASLQSFDCPNDAILCLLHQDKLHMELQWLIQCHVPNTLYKVGSQSTSTEHVNDWIRLRKPRACDYFGDWWLSTAAIWEIQRKMWGESWSRDPTGQKWVSPLARFIGKVELLELQWDLSKNKVEWESEARRKEGDEGRKKRGRKEDSKEERREKANLGV